MVTIASLHYSTVYDYWLQLHHCTNYDIVLNDIGNVFIRVTFKEDERGKTNKESSAYDLYLSHEQYMSNQTNIFTYMYLVLVFSYRIIKHKRQIEH